MPAKANILKSPHGLDFLIQCLKIVYFYFWSAVITLPLKEEINLSLDLQNNLDCRKTSNIKTYALMNSKIFLEQSTSKNDNKFLTIS